MIRHQQVLVCLFLSRGLLSVVFLLAGLGEKLGIYYSGEVLIKSACLGKTRLSRAIMKVGLVYPRGEPGRRGIMALGKME